VVGLARRGGSEEDIDREMDLDDFDLQIRRIFEEIPAGRRPRAAVFPRKTFKRISRRLDMEKAQIREKYLNNL
jgi:hypothetical protein